MWLLGQLFEVLLVVAGLNILWTILRAPFVAREKRMAKVEPADYAALQKAASHEYTLNAIRSLPDPTAAAKKLGLTL